MSSLSPEARGIVQAARGGEEPSLDDRKRIRSSLVLKLGAGVAAASAATSAGTGAAAAGAVKAAGTGLLAGLVPKGIIVLSVAGAIGVGAYAVSEPPETLPLPVAAVVASSSAVPFVTPTAAVAEKTPETSEPSPEPTLDPSPLAPVAAPMPIEPTASPRLAEEVESLREAHTALREGRADEAMDVLDRDAAPKDTSGLEQEREAMRVFALCRLGKTQEARRAAEAFLAKWPKSPLSGRVAASCAR